MVDIKAWLATNAIRVIAILGFVLIVVAFFTLRSCEATRTTHTETKLATGQATAAAQSGQDAANTVGNRMSSDASEDATTRSSADLIDNAQGADAPVAAPVKNAGIAALCRRAAYRDNPRCKGMK